ncbi:putative glutamyl-tRNA amidotransferase subunit A [Xylariaceae sp. FL0594]|nr:putative glutamyl-tRNA amidotransferase subunit A [Xylariaceae sp. FL0594]
MAFNILTATVTDLEDLLNKRVLTSEFLVTEYLKQIEKYNGYLHAVIATAPEDLLLERARFLDGERAAGRVIGPLHGIPLLVKDNIATHPDLGMDTTAGTYALVGSKPPDSVPCVKKELSNFRGLHMPTGWSAVGGLTQSPYVIGGKRWDDGFGGHSAPGGSSSGSCAGVAAGFAPAALGTDTSGSILMPATRHGVYAMKPTLGLVSQDGICPISYDFDSAGPIARSARDIAVLLDVLEWHMPEVVVHLIPDIDDQQDTDIAAAYERLRSLGAIVKVVEVASLDELDVDGMSQIQRVMVSNSQFRETIDSYLSTLEDSEVHNLDELIQFMRDHAETEMPPESPNMTRLETAASFNLSDEAYQEALADMRHFGRRRCIDKCLEDYEVDIILGPGDSRMNELYATAGYPMAVMPLSYATYNGRPFGVCAIARANREDVLVQLMSAWEKSFNTDRQLPTWIGGDPKSEP